MPLQLNYSASKTAARFHASDAFVRGMRGPVGCGKSVMCVMDIFKHACRQKVGPDGWRKSRWAAIRNCYDDQTEILTENGWKLFKDLAAGEKVAMLDDGDELTFTVPTYYYSAPYEGEMIGFEGEGADFLVTPDHRMLVSTRHGRDHVWSPYRFEKASTLFGTRTARVPRDVARWTGRTSEFTPAQFEWLGFWFAEGHVGVTETTDGYERRRLVLTQVKPEGIEYARTLFHAAEIPYTESPRADTGVTFRVRTTRARDSFGDRLFKLLHGVGLASEKRLPRWVKNAPREHLQRFIAGFLVGDGHVGVSTVAYTSSRRLADDLQEIALRAGMVANVRSRDRTGSPVLVGFARGVVRSPEYAVTFVRPSKYRPILQKQSGRYKGWYKQQYAGMVYCVEVPTHKIYVRRRGVGMWCSQTYPELKSTTIKTWQDWFPADVAPMRWDAPITSRLKLPELRVDLEVMFLALDRPDDVKKLKSLELTGAWLNEASELQRWVIDMVTGRVNRYPAKKDGGFSWSGVIMDTNPPDTDHWWYRLAEVDRPEGFEFFSQPPAVLDAPGDKYIINPDAENLQHHTAGADYWLKQVPGKTKEWIKVYLQGQYGFFVDGRPVWCHYNDSIHCAPKEIEPLRGIPLFLGFDYGRTPAMAAVQLTPRGQLRVIDELVTPDGSLTDIRAFTREVVRPYLTNRYPGLKIIARGDPAGGAKDNGGKSAFDIQAEEGMQVESASTNDPQSRLDAVQRYMRAQVDGEPGFLLSPRCQMIRKGALGGYMYRRKNVSGLMDNLTEQPVKNKYSHPADALQYAALAVEDSYEMQSSVRTRKVVAASAMGWT